MISKKGSAGVIIIFFFILFSILVFGFIASMGSSVLDYASDTISPVLTSLGVAGDTNLSQAASYTVTPINTFVQALPWIMGFMYVVALVFSVVFVTSYRSNPHPAFMGFYIMFVVLLILGAIFMSNMYQDIYTQNDEIGTRLQQQTILSYMILYSPTILVLIALISGIFLFGRRGEGGDI